MTRPFYIVFDYGNDLPRVQLINALGMVNGSAPAGFDGAAALEVAKSKGGDAVEQLIDEALSGTSVTVVLIGERTAGLDYVDLAIEQSIQRQNGIVGIFIHDLPDDSGATSAKGAVPYQSQAAERLEAHGYDTHDWDEGKFAAWVEDAATGWKAFARPKPLNKPGA